MSLYVDTDRIAMQCTDLYNLKGANLAMSNRYKSTFYLFWVL